MAAGSWLLQIRASLTKDKSKINGMTLIEGSRAEAELPSEEPEPGPGEPRQSTASWQPLTARAGSELPSLHNGARSPARPRQGPCHLLARWPWQ